MSPCDHHRGLWVPLAGQDSLQGVKTAQNRAWRGIFSAQPCVAEGPVTSGMYLDGLPAPRHDVHLPACPSVCPSAALGCGRCPPQLQFRAFSGICTIVHPHLARAEATREQRHLHSPSPTAGAGVSVWGSRRRVLGRLLSSTPVMWVPWGPPGLAGSVEVPAAEARLQMKGDLDSRAAFPTGLGL